MQDHSILMGAGSDARTPALRLQKWGGLASFLLVAALIISRLIYLTGNLREPFGRFGYSLADFLYGPVWAVSLIIVVQALKERMGVNSPRRMNLALITALLAATAILAVATIRAANRQYHISHPDLNLELSTPVLVVWTTLVAGLNGAGWHLLGWTLILIGSAGWTSRHLPILLSGLYLATGAVSLLVYALPMLEGGAVLLGLIVSVWQGILLLRGEK